MALIGCGWAGEPLRDSSHLKRNIPTLARMNAPEAFLWWSINDQHAGGAGGPQNAGPAQWCAACTDHHGPGTRALAVSAYSSQESPVIVAPLGLIPVKEGQALILSQLTGQGALA